MSLSTVINCLIYNDIRELKNLLRLQNYVELKIFYFTHHLTAEYWSM